MYSERFDGSLTRIPNLFTVLRDIGKGHAVIGLRIANPLNELTEAGAKIKPAFSCLSLGLNVPSFIVFRMSADEVNVAASVDEKPKPAEISFNRSLHKTLRGEFNSPRICAIARHERHAMPNDRVERPATMTVPRTDAAHGASRSARTTC
jgi:hypothetical protein